MVSSYTFLEGDKLTGGWTLNPAPGCQLVPLKKIILPAVLIDIYSKAAGSILIITIGAASYMALTVPKARLFT